MTKELDAGDAHKTATISDPFPTTATWVTNNMGGAYIKIGAKWKYLRRLWYLWNSRVTTLKKTHVMYILQIRLSMIYYCTAPVYLSAYTISLLCIRIFTCYFILSPAAYWSAHTQESSAGMFSALIMCNSDLCGEPGTLINWNHMTSNALSGHGQLAMLLP